MQDLESKWSHLRVPSGNVSVHEAENLMLQYLEMREDWVNAYVQSVRDEDVAKWQYESAYNVAFLRSDESSDKKRDIDAQGSDEVRLAKLELIKAKADVIKAKLKVEGAVLAHHCLKRIYEQVNEERKYL